jgi:aspartate/methionine/tyrosine aminotransferase
MLAGSATPPLSIKELIQLYEDKQESSANLSIDSLPLRKQIAGLYSEVITVDQAMVTNGTTGANSLVMNSFLRRGDHVIPIYPSYTQLTPSSYPFPELLQVLSYPSGNLIQIRKCMQTCSFLRL